MKKYIIYFVAFIAILFLFVKYTDEKNSRIEYQEEAEKWREVAEMEKAIPSVNDKAKEFVNALNKSRHENMLTGKALEEYNLYLENEEEFEGHTHDEIDLGMQDVEILLASTETNEENISSKVLYQIIYEGVFDNPEAGIIDKRIITIVMDIDWDMQSGEALVNQYAVTLLNDSMSDVLSDMTKGSESVEE